MGVAPDGSPHRVSRAATAAVVERTGDEAGVGAGVGELTGVGQRGESPGLEEGVTGAGSGADGSSPPKRRSIFAGIVSAVGSAFGSGSNNRRSAAIGQAQQSSPARALAADAG